MDNLSIIDKKTLNLILCAIRKSFVFYSIEYQKSLEKSSIRCGPRKGLRYVCSKCFKDFDKKSINVDHINPVIPVDLSVDQMSIEQIYRRIFTTSNNLSVLCKDCHKIKSNQENQLRRHFKSLKKTSVKPKKKVAA